MKGKIEKEFQIQFDSKNIQIMKAFEDLDASKPCYLDINSLDYLIQHFDCLGINRSILKLELLPATNDFQKGLSISKKRSPDLIKLSSSTSRKPLQQVQLPWNAVFQR